MAKRKRSPKIIPDEKLICGCFIVDLMGFTNPHCKGYFLSHFHSDHYTGITKKWSKGNIFCSKETAKMITFKFGTNPDTIVPLSLNEDYFIDTTTGNLVERSQSSFASSVACVTLIDANHCPGAVMFIFKYAGKTILHCGDFRFSEKMKSNHCFSSLVGLNELYLDTTFCSPEYKFPPQEQAVMMAVNVVKKFINDPTTLFLFGTYGIGKEKVFMKVIDVFKVKVYVDKTKFEYLKLSGFNMSHFTTQPDESRFHVVPLGKITYSNVQAYVSPQHHQVIGFVPSGWVKFSVLGRNAARVYNIPYSEHSSFDELQECVRYLKPKKIIPTVNADTPQQIESIIESLKPKAKQTLLPFGVTIHSPREERKANLINLLERLDKECNEQEQLPMLKQSDETNLSPIQQEADAVTEETTCRSFSKEYDDEQTGDETFNDLNNASVPNESKYFVNKRQLPELKPPQQDAISLDSDVDTSCNTSVERCFETTDENTVPQNCIIVLSDSEEDSTDVTNETVSWRAEGGRNGVEAKTIANEISLDDSPKVVPPNGRGTDIRNFDTAAMNIACEQYFVKHEVSNGSPCQRSCSDSATIARVIEEQERILKQIQESRKRSSLSSPHQLASKRSRLTQDVQKSSTHSTKSACEFKKIISTFSIEPNKKAPKKMFQTRLSFDGKIQPK